MYNEITCKVKSRLSSAGYTRSKILQVGSFMQPHVSVVSIWLQ